MLLEHIFFKNWNPVSFVKTVSPVIPLIWWQSISLLLFILRIGPMVSPYGHLIDPQGSGECPSMKARMQYQMNARHLKMWSQKEECSVFQTRDANVLTSSRTQADEEKVKLGGSHSLTRCKLAIVSHTSPPHHHGSIPDEKLAWLILAKGYFALRTADWSRSSSKHRGKRGLCSKGWQRTSFSRPGDYYFLFPFSSSHIHIGFPFFTPNLSFN